MSKLILHPTALSQWHALVNEAQASTHMILDQALESYLVFLLLRFSKETCFIKSLLGLDFLKSLGSGRHFQIEKLKDIGDKSLLFCGLFPGLAQKRRVSLDYFSDLGQSAYLSVGELANPEHAALYHQLGEEFLRLQQILSAMRGQELKLDNLDLIFPLGPQPFH